MLIAVLVGPELPTLLGALIGLPVFIFLVHHGIGVPKDTWDFPPHEQWPATWEGEVKAGSQATGQNETIGAFRAWMPYVLIGLILLIGRVQVFGLTTVLKFWTVGWEGILGTSIGKQIMPLYNPGVFPFAVVALLIPLMHPLAWKEVGAAALQTMHMIRSAAVALVFTLIMVFIMMNSGEAAGRDSMLLVLAEAAARLAGDVWLLVAPFVGALGTFISGSNTVSDIMFGPFQFDTAMQADVPLIATLALQAVGGAAGNMICIHNVVAVLTTVGLVGKEGIIIRDNMPVCLLYCFFAGIVGWLLAIVWL
jgi:lactate permease